MYIWGLIWFLVRNSGRCWLSHVGYLRLVNNQECWELLMTVVYCLGLLSLVERKLVLKQGSKSSSMIEKKKNGEEVKAIDSWRKVRFNKFIILGDRCHTCIHCKLNMVIEIAFSSAATYLMIKLGWFEQSCWCVLGINLELPVCEINAAFLVGYKITLFLFLCLKLNFLLG